MITRLTTFAILFFATVLDVGTLEDQRLQTRLRTLAKLKSARQRFRARISVRASVSVPLVRPQPGVPSVRGARRPGACCFSAKHRTRSRAGSCEIRGSAYVLLRPKMASPLRCPNGPAGLGAIEHSLTRDERERVGALTLRAFGYRYRSKSTVWRLLSGISRPQMINAVTAVDVSKGSPDQTTTLAILPFATVP